MTAPNWTTPTGHLFTANEDVPVYSSVSATGASSYVLLAGHLPTGLTLAQNGQIFGQCSSVLNTTTSTFVIRAYGTSGVSDRTFYAEVTGPDLPTWTTPAGYLPVGTGGENYAMNYQWVDFQLGAVPTQAPDSAKITYSLVPLGGILPPGLTLDSTGRITGFIKDSLGEDGYISATGGFDTEAYDQYTYDHTVVTIGKTPGAPRIYQFKIAASDGINATTRQFKIVVTSPNILNDNIGTMPQDIALSTTTFYIQPLQWINGSDLGVIRANNAQDIPVTVYDGEPWTGPVVYEIINNTTPSTNLPEGLILDSNKGYLTGYVPYQPAYTRSYQLTIQATKTDLINKLQSTTTNTFSLAVKGEVETTIQWVTSSTLSTATAGYTSDLSIVAKQTNSDYIIKYSLVSGNLPPGLFLARDGSLVGTIGFDASGVFTFTVQASDVYNLSAVNRTFNLNVISSTYPKSTNIILRSFMSSENRRRYQEFTNDSFVFDPSLIYRYYDYNFGVQHNVSMVLEFGIEQLFLPQYIAAIQENFYRRRFLFGDIKTAIAQDTSGNAIYEVVYIDIVDDQAGSNQYLYSKDNIYYPASIDNMRKQLSLIKLPNGTPISIDDYQQPKFMQTPQAGNYHIPGYMHVVPICYALPGQGRHIISRIKLSGFDFKMMDFEVDRLLVPSSQGNTGAKYLILERQTISDEIASDPILEESNVVWQFDDGVTLTRN